MAKDLSITADVARMVIEGLVKELTKEGHIKLTISVSECARAIGINKTKMYEIVKSDKFPSIVLGSRILIPIIPFLDWLEDVSRKEVS